MDYTAVLTLYLKGGNRRRGVTANEQRSKIFERKTYECSESHVPLSWKSALLNLGKLACCVLQNKCSRSLRYSVISALGCSPLAMFWWQGKMRCGCAPCSMPCISLLVQGAEAHLLQSILCSVGGTARWKNPGT